jgi:hypothetical protein
MRRALPAFVAVVLLGSCESGNVFPPASSSFADFCASWTTAVAAAWARCTGVPASAVDVGACARDEASHAAGRVLYEASRAAACVHDWQTAPCDKVLAQDLPGCEGVVVGLVPTAGACFTEDECQGGARCVPTGLAGCGGVCRLIASLGKACPADEGGCFDDATCVDEAAGPVCEADVAAGGACVAGGPGCARGLVCAPDAAGTSTCRAPLRVGDPCDADAACGSFAVCRGGACVSKPTVGDACGSGVGTFDCLGGWCDAAPAAPGTCRDRLAAGATCTVDDQCAGALLCIDSACAAPTCP